MIDMSALFGGTYANRRVLVTGHTGFKGSWLVLWLQSMGARVSAIGLPTATTPSHHALLKLAPDDVLVDIRDAAAVRDAVTTFAPDIVFHLAAQALVRESYASPSETFDVNVMGLVNVLEAVRATASVRAIVNVTTDKCYRQTANHQPFTESDALGGHDPYSASKACAEIVSASYRESFLANRHGHPIAFATARAGNVIGGGDWATDRLIPDLARAAAARCTVGIRSPHAIRPWQHVLEPLAGYLLLGQQLLEQVGHSTQFSDAWNFGPQAAGHLTVGEVVTEFSRHWCDVQTEIDQNTHRHEAAVLQLDCTKAHEQLGWHPVWNAATMIERCALWYRNWYTSGTVSTRQDLADYVHDAAAQYLPWAA